MSNPHKLGSVLQTKGFIVDPISPEAVTGLARLSDRFELKWVAGVRGKPGVNADINSATEATREIADPDFEILGTNATSSSCTFYAEGGIVLTTAGADADQVILAPHLDANQTAWTQVTWGTDKSVTWFGDLTTGSNITNAIIWAGLKLTNTPVIATDNDQVFFRYEDDVSSGKLVFVSSIGGTDTSTVTDITVAVSTRYRLCIQIGADRCARAWVKVGSGSWAKVYTTAALTDTTDLIPYIGVQADGAAAAKSIRVHGEAISRSIG